MIQIPGNAIMQFTHTPLITKKKPDVPSQIRIRHRKISMPIK